MQSSEKRFSNFFRNHIQLMENQMWMKRRVVVTNVQVYL